MTHAVSLDTRDAIVAGALASFGRHGLRKSTVVDIARMAGVSRSTVYEYFPDKAAIVEACAEAASARFYRHLAVAVNHGETLEDQLVRACVFVTQARRAIEPQAYFDSDEVNILLTRDSVTLLRECADFVAPYLRAATLTGEVRKDLDIPAAGEWIARMLFSLFTTASPSVDMGDADAVAAFVRDFVVRGLAGGRPARRTGHGPDRRGSGR